MNVTVTSLVSRVTLFMVALSFPQTGAGNKQPVKVQKNSKNLE